MKRSRLSLRGIVASIIVIAILVAGTIIFMQQHDTDLQQKRQAEAASAVQYQLFPQPTPGETLLPYSNDLTDDQLDVKTQAGAKAVLSHFQANGIGLMMLSPDDSKTYETLMMGWSKPWRYYFLTTSFTPKELRLIWDEQLVVQANSPELFQKQEEQVRQSLARVSPSVELETVDPNKHYATQADIEQAKATGALASLTMKNVDSGDDYYTRPELAALLTEKVDAALSGTPGLYTVSSSVRALEMQQLLRKLAYPAARASYHTLIDGGAVDFKLSKEAAEKFKTTMEETVSGGTRLAQAEALLAQGIQPTIIELTQRGILPVNHEVTLAYQALTDSLTGTQARVIDELPFFLRFDAQGKLTGMNPVLHIQYASSID